MIMLPADLRALRAALRLTQRQLADRLGVSVDAIRHWEHGRRPIPEPVRRLLVSLLNYVKLREIEEIPTEEDT